VWYYCSEHHAPTEYSRVPWGTGARIQSIPAACEYFVGRFTEVGRDGVLKPIIENESLHEISNDNGVKAVNFVTPKNVIVTVPMLQHL